MNEPNKQVTSDTLLQVLGMKEVEIFMLKQQIETLLKENNQFRIAGQGEKKKEPKLVKK